MIVNNYKVSWRHNNNGASKASSTECHITDTNNNHIVSSVARCNKKDNYNKKLGRKLSFQRAVSQLPDRNVRKILWDNFIESSPKCLNC